MGKLIPEKDYLNENIFKFEDRLESQYTVFLEKNPTYVTYYHVNNPNSIADSGLQNIEEIVGKNSPVRYQKIENFPIYGIENIHLELSDEEEGLTVNYESDGTILPNTIQPLPHDFFIISYLSKQYTFMVTSINFDTIKSNGFYSINFFLKNIDDEAYNGLESQVLEKYTCISTNIGTEDRCILRNDEYKAYKAIDEIYSAMVDRYKILFYSKKFNSFLFNKENNDFLYDKYLTYFIDSNQLFNTENQYDTLVLSNEDYNDLFDIEYENSIYRAIEECSIPDIRYVRHMEPTISFQNSIFKYYNDKVKSVWFIDTGFGEYISDELIDNIKNNVIPENYPIFSELMIKYFNNTIESINNINLDKLKKYKIRYNYYDFIMVPITLFILKRFVDRFMSI